MNYFPYILGTTPAPGTTPAFPSTAPGTTPAPTTTPAPGTTPSPTTPAVCPNTGDPPEDFGGDPPTKPEDPTDPTTPTTVPNDIEGCENAELMDVTIGVDGGVTEFTVTVTSKDGTTTEYPNVRLSYACNMRTYYMKNIN